MGADWMGRYTHMIGRCRVGFSSCTAQESGRTPGDMTDGPLGLLRCGQLKDEPHRYVAFFLLDRPWLRLSVVQ